LCPNGLSNSNWLQFRLGMRKMWFTSLTSKCLFWCIWKRTNWSKSYCDLTRSSSPSRDHEIRRLQIVVIEGSYLSIQEYDRASFEDLAI
jgi:hypothetical protein